MIPAEGLLGALGDQATGDHYSARWVIDAFAWCGIAYGHSERDRSAMDVMAAFTSGRLRLLDNPRMITQFKNLERRTSPIGKDRVDHPKNGKDDLANATAGAVRGRTKPSSGI